MAKLIVSTEFLRNAKKAEGVVFRAQAGTDTIYCAIEFNMKDDSKITYEVDSIASNYFRKDGEFSSAFYYSQSAQFDEEMQTVFEMMRKGDEVQICWTAGNDSDYIRERNLTCDEVRVIIKRKVRGKEKRYSFLVESHTLDQNSPSRMIRLR